MLSMLQALNSSTAVSHLLLILRSIILLDRTRWGHNEVIEELEVERAKAESANDLDDVRRQEIAMKCNTPKKSAKDGMDIRFQPYFFH